MVSQIGRHSQWLMVRVVNNWHKESKGRRGRAREDVIYTSHPIIIIPKLPEVFIRKAYWIIIDMHIYDYDQYFAEKQLDTIYCMTSGVWLTF